MKKNIFLLIIFLFQPVGITHSMNHSTLSTLFEEFGIALHPTPQADLISCQLESSNSAHPQTDEQLIYPINNALVKIKTNFGNIPHKERDIFNVQDNDTIIFGTQCWFTKENIIEANVSLFCPESRIRIDDDTTQQYNRISDANLCWQLRRVNQIPLFFDVNQTGICCLGINIGNDFKLNLVQKNNFATIQDLGTAKYNPCKKYWAIRYYVPNENLVYACIPFYQSNLLTCTVSSTIPSTNSFLSVYSIDDKSLTLPSQKKFTLPCILKSIFRLTNSTYLALTKDGKIVSLGFNKDKSLKLDVKKIIYKNEDGKDTEDFFNFLAVDNCADQKDEQSTERHATSAVLINKDGDLFYVSLKPELYSNGKTTLYKLNKENYKNATNLWLNKNRVAIELENQSDHQKLIKIFSIAVWKKDNLIA